MLKPICIIPARGGSKGIKRKNIRILGKKPLISYSIKTALESNLFQDVIVSTEDIEIAKIAKKYNGKIPFMRPTNLAKDTTTTEAVLLDVIKKLKDLEYDFDTIMLRDCTVPFIDKQDMKKALEIFYKNKCDAVFASIKAHPNPYFGMMEIKKNEFFKDLTLVKQSRLSVMKIDIKYWKKICKMSRIN
jgi:CMP-N-acetylneuraminic acid synthetase